MQGNIGQQWRDHSSLRCALSGLLEKPTFYIARFQPLLNQVFCREVFDRIKQMVMVDIVEGTFYISIDDPTARQLNFSPEDLDW